MKKRKKLRNLLRKRKNNDYRLVVFSFVYFYAILCIVGCDKMAEKLAKILVGAFSGLTSLKYGKELIVFIISLMPILELRGGLIASALLGLNGLKSFIICFIGNIIPIPFVLWLITPLFDKMKKTKLFSGFVNKLEDKAMAKKDKIERLQYIGLMLFVGIPLPGTGAWTGCLIAALLNMDKKKSMIYAILGVIMAGIIMMILSYGILDKIVH